MKWEDDSDGPNIPLITVVCCWLFTTLALSAVGIQLYVCSYIRRHVGIDDICLFSATIIAVILVIQTTWAVVDDGQGMHANGDSSNKLRLVAKVCRRMTVRFRSLS